LDTGVISAAFGALSQQRRLEVIANNLANSATSGFKRDRLSFRDLLHMPPASAREKTPVEAQSTGAGLTPVGFGPAWNASRVRADLVDTDMAQGELEDTGNPLDLAITGQGFFKVQTPEGVRYTRRGNFALGEKGQLVTQEGYPVLGEKGPIRISGSGPVKIDGSGQITVGDAVAGKLAVAQFPEGANLLKQDGCLFAGGDPGPAKLPYTVRQGCLEASNVNAVLEMVEMIEALRSYEACQKMLQGYGQIDGRAAEVGQLR